MERLLAYGPAARFLATVTGLFGTGTALAMLDTAEVGAVLTGIGMVCAAFLWLAKMIWSLSHERTQALDDLRSATGELNRVLSRLERGEAEFRSIATRLTRIESTCEARHGRLPVISEKPEEQ